LSEDARRTYETPKTMVTAKKSATELKAEKGEKPLTGSTTVTPEQAKQTVQIGTTKSKIQVRKEATAKAVVKTQPPRSALTKPKNTITDVANDLYVQANFPTVEEQRKAVQTMGISAARNTMFKPKNVSELKARAGLGLIEPIIGGIEDLTLGLTLPSSRSRPATQQVRIIGAIATPSALDYAVGYGLNKLMNTKIGRKIIGKLSQYGDDVAKYFTSDEEKQFNKIIGNIDELKGKDPGEFAEDYKKTIKEIAEYYEKHPQAARQQVILDLEFNKPQYDKFLSNYALDLNVPASTITAYLMRLTTKQQSEYLAENTKLSSTQISDTIEKLRELNKQKIKSDEALVIITEPSVTETEIPIVVPVEDSSIRSIQEQVPAQAQEQEIIQVPAQIEASPVTTPLLRLSKFELEKRRAMNLSLHNGRRMLYRVSYPDLKQVIGPLDARSFPDALGKAQRQRRTAKKLPRTIIVDLIGERKA